jgi:hypothetical protein
MEIQSLTAATIHWIAVTTISYLVSVARGRTLRAAALAVQLTEP